jgi:hypothetical protein
MVWLFFSQAIFARPNLSSAKNPKAEARATWSHLNRMIYCLGFAALAGSRRGIGA